MEYLMLGLFALATPALTVVFYFVDHKLHFLKVKWWIRQIVYGIAFGIIAILCTEFGVKDNGAVMNVRDSAPIAAGLIFGWPAGLISGFIGGVERFISAYWHGTYYTQWACSISTFISGAVAAFCSRIIFRKGKINAFQGLFIGLVLETSHILMIFITNMDDTINAYRYVDRIGNTMIGFVALSVGISVALIQLLHIKDRKINTTIQKKWKLSTILHISLFLTMALAYINVALYTRNIQTRIAEDNAKGLLINNVDDTVSEIKDTTDNDLLSLASEVTTMIESRDKSGATVDNDFLRKVINGTEESGIHYPVSEINIIDKDGFIVISSEDEWTNPPFDMRQGTQAKEFYDHIIVNHENQFVQEFGPTTGGKHNNMKYAAHALEKGGFVQVGYADGLFYSALDDIISQVAKNRRVGNEGFVIITDNSYNIRGESSTVTGISSLAEMGFDTTNFSTTHQAEVMYGCSLKHNIVSGTYRFSYGYEEGYFVIGFISDNEINLNRDLSTYVYTYLELIIFALIFLVIYFLVDRIILDDIDNVNDALKKIANGDLDVKIDAHHSKEFVTVSNSINATVATLKDYIAKESERIDQELALAKDIQLSSLPSNNSFLTYLEFSIYAKMKTAKEVGGDFYDYFPLDNNRFAILIADVSGKGIPAAMFMMRTKSLIKSLLETGLAIEEAITRANKQLCDNNDSKMFVTCWCGVIERDTGNVQYVNAGHNPPVIRSNGIYSYLKGKANFVLGGLKIAKYDKQTLKLEPGDIIFLYTDGITEAKIDKGVFYGEQRLLNTLNNINSINPRLVTEGVMKDTLEFTGEHEQFDDMTLLTFAYYGKVKDYTFIYEPNKEDYTKATEEFNDVLKENHVNKEIKDKVNICFEEILTNIIKYSYKDSTGHIGIRYYLTSERLTVVFLDSGEKFNPLEKEDPDVSLKAVDRPIGGLGIYMVKNMVDNIYYTYQENHNILIFDILLKEQGEKK